MNCTCGHPAEHPDGVHESIWVCAGCYRVIAKCSCTPDPLAAFLPIAAQYTPADWPGSWDQAPDEVEWLYDPLLEAGTVNSLFAKPGVGKSLLALEIAARLAFSGTTVVYLDDENRLTGDVIPRLKDMGYKPGELAALRFYSFAGLPPLDTQQGGLHLLALAAVNDAMLVILDTTTRMVAGRENDSDTFLQLYRNALVPLKDRGITVLRLDHPGKDSDRGQRGSSAKDGDVDTIWRMEQTGDGLFRLERFKSRNGHGEPVHDLRRETDPLRHHWLTAGAGNAVDNLMSVLDDLSVPVQFGRDKVRRVLEEKGIKVSNDALNQAIRIRRNLSGTGSGQSGTGHLDLSAAVPPYTGDSGQVGTPAALVQS